MILPKITIVTPSYNQGQFIEATIRSVLSQTYSNIEYIIIDGGSTDDTMDVIERYRERIHLVIHEKDKGQSDAINKGFKIATGELVGWINSDDILYPYCVSSIVDLYLKNLGGSIFYSVNSNWINSNGDFVRSNYINIPDKNYLLNQQYEIFQPGSFYPIELVRKIGFIDDSIHYCMDLDLWLRLLEHGTIHGVTDRPIAAYRMWEETKTSTGGRHFLVDIRKTLLKHGALPFSRSVSKTRYYSFKKRAKEIFNLL